MLKKNPTNKARSENSGPWSHGAFCWSFCWQTLMPHLLIVTQISVDSKNFFFFFYFSLSPFTARSASARLRRTEREGSAITSPSKCLLLFTSTLDSIGSRLNSLAHNKVLSFTVPAQYYGNWQPLAWDCGNAEAGAGSHLSPGNSKQ